MLKKYLVFILNIFIVSCSDSPVGVQHELDIWYNITPKETDYYHAVYFINELEGWVAGSTQCLDDDPRPPCPGWGGVIYHTRDGGVSWKRALVKTDTDLNALYFFNNLNGLAIRFNVHETSDGGSSWTEATKLIGPIVRDMEVNEESICWAAASHAELGGAVVLKSEDEQRKWEVIDGSFREGGVYLSITAPTANTIYAAGFYIPSKALLVKTANAGETWEDVPLPGGSTGEGERYYCIKFVNDSTGWLGGLFGEVYYTSNGGDIWQIQEIGSSSAAIYDIDAIDENHAVAVTSEGSILVSRDGGINWNEEREADSEHPPSSRVFYHSSGNVYVVGDGVALTAKLSN